MTSKIFYGFLTAIRNRRFLKFWEVKESWKISWLELIINFKILVMGV